jgi:Zn-dependent peptidase ImmA (M78 family)/transcriptional regulator with XRE-family HTH domain
MPRRQTAYINREVLRWARETLNLSIEEAARDLGVEVLGLKSWEEGESLPSISELRKAAALYRRPLAAFFLPSPPKDFQIPHDFRRLPGRTRTFSPELATELREAAVRRQTAIELAEEDELSAARATFLSTASISDNAELVADNTRRMLGISSEQVAEWSNQYDALNGWKNAVERLGILVFHFSGVEVDEVRGYSISESPFPVIGVNGSDSPAGRTFTLLHEFGHLLIGRGGSCDLAEVHGIQSEDQRIEIFCNRFAGAVLVPVPQLQQLSVVLKAGSRTEWSDDQLHELARLFWVSREVVLRRLLIIGKTSEAFYRRKRAEYEERFKDQEKESGGFLSVPRKSLRAVGQPFTRIVLDAFNREEITASDVSDYLGVRLKHLGEIERLLASHNVLTGGDR